jgi:hypothetical protein
MIDDEQIDKLCSAIGSMFSFQRCDALEHVLGPCDVATSFASGVHRIADSLEKIAEAIEMVADNLPKK